MRASSNPRQIAIVSTGLIFHNTEERKHLMSRSFGMVILDEAHRACGKEDSEEKERVANNLLSFMFEIAKRARHVLLGTATPIQTDVEDMWDLLKILGMGPNRSSETPGANGGPPTRPSR